MRFHALPAIFFLVFFPLSNTCWGNPLSILYFERPPYYFTEDNRAEGLLIDLARELCQDAGISVTFQSRPPARILQIIEDNRSPVCTVGWFKTAGRQQFAQFTIALFRNQPLTILTSVKQAPSFSDHHTLADIFNENELVLAKLSSFSYGEYVDNLITELDPPVELIAGRQSALPHMIVNERASYMLIAPEEVPELISRTGLDEELFTTVKTTDVPPGNSRYFMCSPATPDETITRLNSSIARLVQLN